MTINLAWHRKVRLQPDIVDYVDTAADEGSIRAVGADDKIYIAPSNGHRTHKMAYWDLNTETFHKIGAALPIVPHQYNVSCNDVDAGHGYVMPAIQYAKHFVKVEVATDTVTQWGTANSGYMMMYGSIIAASNGFFYMFGDNKKPAATRIDPVTNGLHNIGSSSGWRYRSPIEVNGKLYVMSRSTAWSGHSGMGEIDLATDTHRHYGITGWRDNNYGFRLAHNGNVYEPAVNNAKIRKVDLAARTLTDIGPTMPHAASDFFNAPNGMCYFMSGTEFYELNPFTDTIIKLPQTKSPAGGHPYVWKDGIAYRYATNPTRSCKVINIS